MVNVFIIHGAFGNPEENWFPWLKSKLEKLGCNVFVPKFPTPENQNLENWNEIFEKYKDKLDENSIVIGHSLGPAFLLRVLERIDSPIKGAFFVSGFTKLLGNETFDSINKTFVDKDFNWDKIRNNCKHFSVYHSNNDPYVPIECANELSEKLGVNLTIIENAGHFNKDSGYIKFEKLLEEIKGTL